MKFTKLSMAAVMGIFILSAAGLAFATDDPGTVKAEIASDKENIQAERAEMKENATEAKTEEKAIQEQIKTARESGDAEKAGELKEQLIETHKSNVAEKREDKQALHAAKKELRQDKKAAKKAYCGSR
ncbi:MAG: hypothetical protein WC522_04035 [Candidatus Omnitrophota bacterium]